MRLEHDLEIRRAVGSILSADVAMGVGDGWHRIVARALSEIWDIAEAAGIHVAITHVENRRGGLIIRTDVRARCAPTAAADAIDEIRFHASDKAMVTCERCGALGFAIRGEEPRVRCARCESEQSARDAVRHGFPKQTEDACRYYIDVCAEHERLFPVGNIVVRVCADDQGHRLFLDEVHERLIWWRAGSWIEGVDEALREHFRRLHFVR